MTIQSKFRWGFGIFFIISGFLLIVVNGILGSIFLFLGLIVTPYTNRKIFSLGTNNNLDDKDFFNAIKTYDSKIEKPFVTTSFKAPDISSDEQSPTKQKKNIKQKPNSDLITVKFKYERYEDHEDGTIEETEVIQNSEITERVVDFHTGKRDGLFTGFCHLRKDIRTFSYSRIRGDVLNVNTGEVMKPMEWRYSIQGTKVAEKAMKEEAEQIERENKRSIELAEANSTWMRLVEPAPIVNFEGKKFAIGYLKSSNGYDHKEKIVSKGGKIQELPNGKSDYIVINSTIGVHQSFENAIKKIIDRGIIPVIISEEHWLDAMK